jgi:hypothetical protein
MTHIMKLVAIILAPLTLIAAFWDVTDTHQKVDSVVKSCAIEKEAAFLKGQVQALEKVHQQPVLVNNNNKLLGIGKQD